MADPPCPVSGLKKITEASAYGLPSKVTVPDTVPVGLLRRPHPIIRPVIIMNATIVVKVFHRVMSVVSRKH
ncbi:hypothetical protein JCM17478_10410 [Thermopirellula anaerolimosa]